jgi:hypothetical protein
MCPELRAVRDRDACTKTLATSFERAKGIVFREELLPAVVGAFGPVYESLDGDTRGVVDEHVLTPLFAMPARDADGEPIVDWRKRWQELREADAQSGLARGSGPVLTEPPIVY